MDARRLLSTLLVAVAMAPSAFGQMVEEVESESISSNKPAAEAPAAEQWPEEARLILEQTNEFRRSENLKAVEVNKQLEEAAQYFAGYVARTDKYGHTADGSRPSQRASRFGYEYCLISENIAYQYSSAGFNSGELANRFVEGWKQSPGHRKNMLDAAVTETGVAVAQSPNTGYWYAVQMFGRPKSMAIEFTITNRSTASVSYIIDKQTFELPPRYSRTHTDCRESSVDIDAALNKTITPANGERYLIEGEGGDLRLRRE